MSFNKNKVGHFFRRSKAIITWVLMIEGNRHTFELSHSHLSGKKRIWVDGVRVLTREGWKEIVENHMWYIHSPLLHGREVSIRMVDATSEGLSANPFAYHYYIYIDDHDARDLDEMR